MTNKLPAWFDLSYQETMVVYAKFHAMAGDDPDKINDIQRNLGSTDLFYLFTFILNRPDALNAWIFDRCRDVQRDPDNHLDLWARAHYKENLLSENILTPDGWRKFGDLDVGDDVFAPSGNPVKVLARTPVQSDPVQYQITFSTYQNDVTTTITAGSQHLWDVLKENRKIGDGVFEEAVISSQDIFNYTQKAKSNVKKRWLRVIIAEPLHFPVADLVIDPYTLGVWLGDGACRTSCITNGLDDIRAKLVGNIKTVRNVGNTKVFSIIGLITKLKTLGLGDVSSDLKFIPDVYKRSSIEQRLQLIQGMMDTDGHITKRGNAKFHTISEKMADDFCEVLATLGSVPHKHKTKTPLGKDFFVVTFNPNGNEFVTVEKHKKNIKPKNINYNFWYIKDVKRVESKPSRCIQVDGGKYVIGERHIPTHNSSIITFALTIFDIINNPEITVGIFSHTKPVAKKFLSQIKTEFENNKALPRLWPDVFHDHPRSEASKWSEDAGIIVKRKGNPKEATIEAHGLVDGQPTGRHFKLMIYDDVVTIESVSTPDQIKKTTYSFQMSDNLGVNGCPVRIIGTKYHLFDTYRTIEESGAYKTRRFPATHDGTEAGKPVFLTREELVAKRKKQGPFVYGSQMLLNPTSDKAMGFDPRWLVKADVDYNAAMRQLWRFIIVDPAGGKQRKGNDYSTFWVIGHGADKKYRVLDMVRDRLRLSQRCEALMDLHRQWKPHLVAYEEYGMQADIEHIEYVQEQELYEFDITPLGGSMNKEARILRLVPYFENGYDEDDGESKSRIILPNSCQKLDYQDQMHDLVKDFIEQEYTAFPVLAHDDMIDGLARIVDLEEMGLIELPKIEPPKGRNLRVNAGLKNAGKKGDNSWLTA